ncbi:dephospho-CoA kinase [Bauldia litoralis]|uniref:Dephospho-CoA kinase n=1 Tax=Bauldia litoralis TaxID=665467 RepID=A0A1G6BPW9_9HYPH|nr:dephospho-CoA kinase [Bauldia litoralis]SDB22650.1 dephospho-CoA kinase [Bauldia litoralis]
MLLIGLTGSVAMGKSTTAAMFAEAGLPVFDADRTVHELYRGAAAPVVEAAFPGTTENGVVDRDRLRDRVLGDDAAMARLEALIHPLVRTERDRFLREAAAGGYRAVVLDIPLLFETATEGDVDMVIVVTTSAEIQMARMLARDGMTRERAEAMIARQVPDPEKRRRAHFLIDTSTSIEDARRQVGGVLRAVAGMTGRV